MKEELFLETIKSVIGNNYIGDDCAYLEDLGIVVSQDSLVQDVHFKTEYTSAYQLGYKSIMVNISDICASGAVPKYVSIGLSLPTNTEQDFVKEFYLGVKEALNKTGGAEIIGGDITGADKIMVSVCVIGATQDCKISSRANAKAGQLIVTTGKYGSSAGGLELLLKGGNEPVTLMDTHRMPIAQFEASQQVSKNIQENYAMMDTSDGIADALFKISKASNKTLVVDFDKIKFDPELKRLFPESYNEKILYGGEDYQLVATVPENILPQLTDWYVIGEVQAGEACVKLNASEQTIIINNMDKCYNHFNE